MTTFIAYQILPTNTYSMIVRCHGMPGRGQNHVELALASFGRLDRVERTAIELLQFLGVSSDILRGDLAEDNYQMSVPLRVPVFHQETLDLAGSQIERTPQQFRRETATVDLVLSWPDFASGRLPRAA